MIYLIGVDHLVQLERAPHENQKERFKGFREHVEECIGKYGIDLIAEEYSPDAIQRPDVTETTLQIVARQHNLEHRLCDPTRQERELHRIATDEKRERFWLRKIEDARDRQVLFVCGSSHLRSFETLLVASRFEVSQISDGWGR